MTKRNLKEGRARIEPRLLKMVDAAAYCGLSIPIFKVACPVQPIKLIGRIPRYARKAIDAWLDELSTFEDPDDELDPVKIWEKATERIRTNPPPLKKRGRRQAGQEPNE